MILGSERKISPTPKSSKAELIYKINKKTIQKLKSNDIIRQILKYMKWRKKFWEI